MEAVGKVTSLRRASAERRMREAKAYMTRAARAVLQGLPLAEAMARAALDELNEARRQLRATGTGGEG